MNTKQLNNLCAVNLFLFASLTAAMACNAEVAEDSASSQAKGTPTPVSACHMEIQCFWYNEFGNPHYLHQSSAESFHASGSYTLTDTAAVNLVAGKLGNFNADDANYFGPGTPGAFTTALSDQDVAIPIQTVTAVGAGMTNPHQGDDISQCAQLHYTRNGTEGWACHYCCNSVDRGVGIFR